MAMEPIRNLHPNLAKIQTEQQGWRASAVASTAVKYVPVAFSEMGPLDTVTSVINDSGGTPANIAASEIVVSNDQGMGFVTMLGFMNSPITGLLMVMSGPVRALATVLQRHVDNQQSGEAA